MNDQAAHIAQLIKKLFDGSLSAAEKIELNSWLEEHPQRKSFVEGLNKDDALFEEALEWISLAQEDSDEWLQRLSATTWQRIQQQQKKSQIKKRSPKPWLWYAAAAVLLCIAGASIFIQQQQESTNNSLALNQIKPGKHQATLHLPDGSSLTLSEKQDELQLSDKRILSYKDGEMLMDLNGKFKADQDLRLSVPRAGNYKMRLPDGSLVWLNSASTIRFPIAFQQHRLVALNGEAFFEVQQLKDNKNRARGFSVNAPNQSIEVTGTQFNVNTFNKEALKTTLVEGHVNVRSAQHKLSLMPNEQSVLSPTGISKVAVDVSAEIAWKDNRFNFNETSLQDAMLQLSRWYDLEIVYKKNIPDTYFYGEFSRQQPLQKVLKILEESGVKFEFKSKNHKNNLIVLP